MFKFCTKVKLHPDLLTSSDLKRIASLILGKSITEEKSSELNYLHFEKILKSISELCFPSGNSIKQLISHIKPLCQVFFSVNLATVTPLSINVRRLSPSKMLVQHPATVRNSNQTSRNLKALNNSTSHKHFFKSDSIANHREAAVNATSASKIRSPKLKIISIREKIIGKGKMEKVVEAFNRLKGGMKCTIYFSRHKKAMSKMAEKIDQANIRIVITMQRWAIKASFNIWRIKAYLQKIHSRF